MSDSDGTGNAPARRSKVARLIDEYGLEGIGAELERLWTADGDERLSLRALADFFNQRLLREAMTEIGMRPLEGEVENTYRLLTGDDVSRGSQTGAIRQLEREGLDIERLESDFVSYQAIRTYLKSDRGAEYRAAETDNVERAAGNIGGLQGRLRAISESKLDQLRTAGDLDLGEFSVTVDVRVLCADCGTQYGVLELLERGGCHCS
jgi:hypothetical protein